jgi:hypothetical protein
MSQSESAMTLKIKNSFNLLSCGFVSGVLQALMFNPWDRALYLSIKVYRFTLYLLILFKIYYVHNLFTVRTKLSQH